MKHDVRKRQSKPLDADDERLLVALAKLPAGLAGSPADTARLNRLVTHGYLVQDPNLKTATFRLTIRGWAVVRKVAPTPAIEEPFDVEEE